MKNDKHEITDTKPAKTVNSGNKYFYQDIYSPRGGGIEPFYTKAGLAGCIDLKTAMQKQMLPTDKHASLLVVGAGDGREINYLKGYGYDQITGLEQNGDAVQKLCLMYEDNPSIRIVHADIQDYKPSTLYDCVLWMWCGFDDFSKEEQERMIPHVMSFLKPEGTFILDNPNLTSTMNVAPVGDQLFSDNETYNHVFNLHDDVTYRGYVPSREELMEWSNSSGMVSSISAVDYKTESDRDRFLLCMQKQTLAPQLSPHQGYGV